MNLNNVIIMGNLTKNPDMKKTTFGKPVCAFSIANNRIYLKNGEKMVEVSYFDVEAWGAMAESCYKFLTKGSGIIVEGRLKQERWDKDGKAHSHLRITASSVHFMPKKQRGNEEKDSPVPSGEGPVMEEAAVGASSEDITWQN